MSDWLRDLVAGWMPGDRYKPTDAALAWLRSKHEVAARLQPERIAEIGVRAGYSGYAMLSAAPNAHYLGIDLRGKTHGGKVGAHLHAERLLSRFQNVEFRHADSQYLDRLPVGIDLLHIDGDHTVGGAYLDLDLALVSGVRWALVDDVDFIPDVRRAVDLWLSRRGLDAEFIHDGHRGSALIRMDGR